MVVKLLVEEEEEEDSSEHNEKLSHYLSQKQLW